MEIKKISFAEDPVAFIYDEYTQMRDLQNQGFREFNYSEAKERDRTLIEYLDDCQKRANGYAPSRDSQGKDAWQANVFTNYTRNKIKAHIASVAKTPPDIRIKAVDEFNVIAVDRSEVMKNFVRASELECGGNPEKLIYLDSWDCAINGTKVKYVGYVKNTQKSQKITNYDLATGEIEYEDGEEVIIEDNIVEIDIPLQNFFIKDAYISEIQKQPSVIWVSYMNSDEFEYEFGKYKDAKKVKEAGYKFDTGENDAFYGEKWNDRVEAGKIEVVRYYDRFNNRYCIVANGILILNTIMLWGGKKKLMPFGKTIYEPFANSNFFWGNSLVNILMGGQDVANAFINSMIDKSYKTLNTPLLVGMVNKDALELEDEYVTGDTKIYVDDINQVQPMPLPGIQAGEMNMLQFVTRGIDEASTDSLQSGYGGTGSTAREIVLANERAEELKGLFFILIKDLYVQKTRLRISNILMNYSNPLKVESIVGPDGSETFKAQFKAYNVPNAQLSSGETGVLQIGVGSQQEVTQANKTLGYMESGEPFNELDVKQEEYRVQGKAVEIMMITSDFLDNWEYEIEVESESFYQRSKALDKAMEIEKLQVIAQYFPVIFQDNQIELFRGLMKNYNESADKYLNNMGKNVQNPMGAMGQAPPGGGQVGEQVLAPTQSMPSLSGV